jgi:hypothetical protein
VSYGKSNNNRTIIRAHSRSIDIPSFLGISNICITNICVTNFCIANFRIPNICISGICITNYTANLFPYTHSDLLHRPINFGISVHLYATVTDTIGICISDIDSQSILRIPINFGTSVTPL